MTTDINILFARDPLELSDKDIEVMVDHLRLQRKHFEPEKVQGKATPKKPSKEPGISLADLGIEL